MISDEKHEEFNLLGIFADIRHELGCGHKPMLADLPKEVKSLKAKNEIAMKTLNQIATMPRKTREQRLASSCVAFLESMP